MSNTSIKDINDVNKNERECKCHVKEQKNICFSQKEDSEVLSESNTKVTMKSIADELVFNVMNLKPLSTAANVTVINMQDKQPQNNSNMLEELNKQGKQSRTSVYLSQQQYPYQHKKPTVWVQFSFGKGSGMGQGKGDFDYDPESRNVFVLLVMLIVLVMLLITAGTTIAIYNIESWFNIFHKPSLVMIIGVPACLLILSYTMMCVPALGQPPCIYFILVLVLILMTLLTAIITCHYRTDVIIYAFFATSALVLLCTILACTSFDFTSYWLYFIGISLVCSILVIIIFTVQIATGTYMKPLHLLILVVFTLLQSVGLIMELQMVLGGKSIELNESDYGLGAYMLYTSIISLFLNLVQCLGLLD